MVNINVHYIKLLIFIISISTAFGQTFYSPNGVGSVGESKISGNTTTSADIFVWDINANSNTANSQSFDTHKSGGKHNLNIGGSNDEVFRVVFGVNIDTSDAFWDTDRTWSSLITTSSSNAYVPYLTQATVNTYTYNGFYSLVDTSSRGSFSLSDNSLTWSAVPEPTNALVGLVLLCGLIRRRR